MDQEEELSERARQRIALVLFDGMSLNAATKIVHINYRTLQRYVEKYRNISRFALNEIELDMPGKQPFLNKLSIEALHLFGLAMDWNDYPISRETAIQKMLFLHLVQEGLSSIEEVPKPSCPTIKKIIHETGLRIRSVRQGATVDALRSSKANVEYLGDWFNKLEGVRKEYNILPKNIWNADEVGVQFSDLNVKFLTNRACVRANMTNEHITVLITSNAGGFLIHPYLIFPGTNISVIPNIILENEEVWPTFASSGWMDVERFQGWILKFINEVKQRKEEEEKDEYTLLIVDGHNSRLNADTIFTAAINRVIVLVGPSQLTNSWQANDAGINKSFKENLRSLVAIHIEAKQTLANSDVALMITEALKKPNMKKSIINSYRHVGIEPFDRLQMARMISDERPDESTLDNPAVTLAVAMCKEHLNTLDNLVGQKRKRDEQEKEKKKLKKVGISTSYAMILTNAENLAAMQLGMQYTLLTKLHAVDLHVQMIKMGWTLADITQPGKKKFHTMKTLHAMIYKRLESLHDNQTKKIEEEVAKQLFHAPPVSIEAADLIPPAAEHETTP